MIKIIKNQFQAKSAMEGAGVPIFRVFGYNQVPEFDPFLMLDYFNTPDSRQAAAGFPWHPHRGIETITYLLKGAISHQDSIGNEGLLSSGDVQWMTAGRGIIHQEMPQLRSEGLEGFQFWLNLPARKKMMDPAYTEIKSPQIPVYATDNMEIKIISGTYAGLQGPIDKEDLGVSLMDIFIKKGGTFDYSVLPDKNVFVFVYSGSGKFDNSNQIISEKTALTFSNGDQLCIEANSDLHFILGMGIPISEPIAWQGPVVMNTHVELVQAFEEVKNGTFIQERRSI